jgi:hypothetical protein
MPIDYRTRAAAISVVDRLKPPGPERGRGAEVWIAVLAVSPRRRCLVIR